MTKMWTSGFESYSSSSFGGAGGYTQSPGGFGSLTPSQAEKKSRARAQHIVPCTISQLLSATLVDEVFKIGNVEISQVSKNNLWKSHLIIGMKNEIKLTSFKNT